MWTKPTALPAKKPPENRRSFQSPKSTNGWANFVSTKPKMASSTTPATRVPIVAGAVQLTAEFCRPYVSSVIPRPPMIRPSSHSHRWRSRSCSPRVAAIVTKMTRRSAGTTQNTQRQLAMSIIRRPRTEADEQPEAVGRNPPPLRKPSLFYWKQVDYDRQRGWGRMPIPIPWTARPLIIRSPRRPPPTSAAQLREMTGMTIILTSPRGRPFDHRPPARVPNERL